MHVVLNFLQMIFPWMFDEVHALRPFKDAVHLLAEKEDWPPLYDISALKNNKVVHIFLSEKLHFQIRVKCFTNFLKC